MRVDEAAVARNLDRFGPFAATERVLAAAAKAGADRQAMHEHLRLHSLAAWAALQQGQSNPLVERLAADPELQHYLPELEIRQLMDAHLYLGNAPTLAQALVGEIRSRIRE
jgi:adenylosuccinate lyase